MRLVAYALALLMFCGFATAQEKTFKIKVGTVGTAESYLQYCPEIRPNLSFEDTVKANYCFGYLRGVIDLNNVLEAGGRNVFCAPKDIDSIQIDALLRSYIKAHPQEPKTPTPALLAFAIKEKYPCAENDRSR